MTIEQKLEEIIFKGLINAEYVSTREAKYCSGVAAQAILSSPDIAVVERDKLQKMQRVVVGLLEDCKLNLEAIGGCDHEVGICVCGVISLIADAEEALNER